MLQLFHQISHPLIKWAQRKDTIFLQIQLRDITQEKIDLTPTALTFQGQSDNKNYGFTVQFFDEINKQQSKWTKTGFHLFFALSKQDQSQPFWPRLTKQKQKNQYIQVDWQKWVDEDQQQEQGQKGLGDFNPAQMQNFDFANMGGAGGLPGGFGGQGSDDQEGEGNLDDLDKEEEVEEQNKP